MKPNKKQVVIKNSNYKKKNTNDKKVVIYSEKVSSEELKISKKIKWNFEINDLVIIKNTESIGLIISDREYRDRKVETNYYFVLFENRIVEVWGGRIKKLI